MTASCDTCRFWDEHMDRRAGSCRRYAPRPHVDGDALDFPHWPWTEGRDWCGEWQDAAKKDQQEVPR